MLVLVLACVATVAARLGELARTPPADVFTLIGEDCSPAQCATHGAGATTIDPCACACPETAPLFREDKELCVDDLSECTLATFGSGPQTQRIPFVFLPLKGQIIHPSNEITFPDVKTPICAVSGAQFLTRKGFVDLRNTLDADVPFNLFRDEGRTFLQWTGEDEVRARMSGRVMVVRLLCRDIAATPSTPLDLRGVFTPCVAFRVQGTPFRLTSNVTEVQFAPNAQTSETGTTSGLTTSEYVAIGISSLFLGLIYVASVFLYLHIRKRRKLNTEENSRRLKGLKKKDGSMITERDIIRIKNERVQTLSVMGEDDGIVKSNPLLSMGRQFQDIRSNCPTDSGSNLSDSEDFCESIQRNEESGFSTQTTVVVHPQQNEFKLRHDGHDQCFREESGIEKLPDEHVSIVETTDDREIHRPVGTTRRKLYFNPAYFEPHLMAEPPQAALEFLTKIREVICIAKHKMATKRFQPVLNEIPEEDTYPSNPNSIDLYQGLGSQRSGSVISLKRENSRKRSVNCLGCPGCQSSNRNGLDFKMFDIPACANCLNAKGEKQQSIRKWLEDIPTGKQQSDFINNSISSQQSLTEDAIRKIRKQYSFSSKSVYTMDIKKQKRASTSSVKSEPSIRNYNLPLPEFRVNEHNQHNHYGQTVSKIDGIQAIGLHNYSRSGSLRQVNPHKHLYNKNTLPDMVNEAIAIDHTKLYNPSSSDDEIINDKRKSKCSRLNSSSPSGNDYETDSLERTSNKKMPSIEYSDVPSSQASPSLSTALPLEEELTMRNAVYKIHSSSNSNTPSPQRDICIDKNFYDSEDKTTHNGASDENMDPHTDYSLVSEVYVNNNFGSAPSSPSASESSVGSRKLLKTENNIEEKPGCLTIEVKDCPENYIKIHESDDFEPDTLDRKHSKNKAKLELYTFSRRSLLDNIENKSPPRLRIELKSSGTFKKTKASEATEEFCSLKNEIERPSDTKSPLVFNGSKSLTLDNEESCDEIADWDTEEGRILTLELRHSKRQRQCTPPTKKQLKSLPRPDILPPLPPTEDVPIYEQPNSPPRKVEILEKVDASSKNVNGRSLSPRITTPIETATGIENLSFHDFGPSCSPMRASVQLQYSDYENVNPSFLHDLEKKRGELCRISSKKRTTKVSHNINTNTFVKGHSRDEFSFRTRLRRKKGSNVEDSGYLSSDSTGSRQVQRKIVVAKIVSCSESDDTENEARSESGAESVETHSVYFGSFRRMRDNNYGANVNNIRNFNQSLENI